MAERPHVTTLIVGAGMTGVSMAAHLIKRGVLDYNEFRIVDQNADYGGVWESNKYPGAACDVPSHLYVLRYFLKPDWSRWYAPRAEIQKYYVSIAEHFKLRQSTVFNTKVHEARWNEENLIWEVQIEDLRTGKRAKWNATSIVHAGGQFSRPKRADIPGAKDFEGAQWHTAQWRDDIDLTGKRVGIIGTGPSTAQVAPRIVKKVKQLTIYQRSATHVLPRGDGLIEGWKKTLFTYFYPALWLYHVLSYFRIERSKRMWLRGTPEHEVAKNYAMNHLNTTVKDPVMRKKLYPNGEFGCKRLLILDDWYPMFNEPNVELITDKPIRITEKGIVSKPPDQLPESELKDQPDTAYPTINKAPNAHEEEREIDVLIWGTGFEMSDHQGGHFAVYGVDGLNLKEHWGDSPNAYYSVAISKFPNFLCMLGPNAANFWSVLTTIVEIQAEYNTKMVKYIKQKNEKAPFALYPDAEKQIGYNKWIKSQMGNIAILAPGCHNYYTNKSGEATYWNPFHGWYYAWLMAWPKFSDFVMLSKPKALTKGYANGHANGLIGGKTIKTT